MVTDLLFTCLPGHFSVRNVLDVLFHLRQRYSLEADFSDDGERVGRELGIGKENVLALIWFNTGQ